MCSIQYLYRIFQECLTHVSDFGAAEQTDVGVGEGNVVPLTRDDLETRQHIH